MIFNYCLNLSRIRTG